MAEPVKVGPWVVPEDPHPLHLYHHRHLHPQAPPATGSSSSSSSSSSSGRRWQEVTLGKQGTADGGAEEWPERRHAHTLVAWEAGSALCLYGGLADGGLPLGDLLLFDLVRGTWRRVKVKDAPASRHSHTAVVWRDSMFVFGGIVADAVPGMPASPTNTILEFNFRKAAWSEVQAKGDFPVPRWNHSAVITIDRSAVKTGSGGRKKRSATEENICMWVFGGLNTDGDDDNHLYCFHFQTRTWERVFGDGEPPSERNLHSAVVHPNGRSMLILGGRRGNKKNLSDVHQFHFVRREWGQLDKTAALPASFTSRRGHRAAVVGNIMMVHGGYDKSGPSSDVYLFDFDTWTWSQVLPTEGEHWVSARHSHALASIAGRVWVFGGIGVDAAADDQAKWLNLCDFHQFLANPSDGFHQFSRGSKASSRSKGSRKKDSDKIDHQAHVNRHARDFLDILPAEVCLRILSYLSVATIGATLPLVNKKWKRFVDNDALWRQAVRSLEDDSHGSRDDDSSSNGSGTPRTPKSPRGQGGRSKSFKQVMKDILTNNPLYDTSLPPRVRRRVLTACCGSVPVRYQHYSDIPGLIEAQAPIPEVKVMICGAAGVGKSALAVLFCEGKFDGNYCITVNSTWRKKCIINNRIVLLEIIDEKYQSHIEKSIKACDAFLFVYSVDDRDSYTSLCSSSPVEGFWPMVKRIKKGQQYSIVLVGNKCDVDDMDLSSEQCRDVTPQDGAAFARIMSQELGSPVPFIETSARLNQNVTTAFAGLAYMELHKQGLMTPRARSLSTGKAGRQGKDKCLIS